VKVEGIRTGSAYSVILNLEFKSAPQLVVFLTHHPNAGLISSYSPNV
jgi:hypothetical protein